MRKSVKSFRTQSLYENNAGKDLGKTEKAKCMSVTVKLFSYSYKRIDKICQKYDVSKYFACKEVIFPGQYKIVKPV